MEKKNVNFEDVVYFQEGPGVRNWQFRDSGIKLINIRNLVDSELCLENTTNYLEVEEVENKYKHFLLNAGDFVMASSGVTWGKIAEVHEEHLPLCLNTSIIRLVSKDTDVLDKWYLYYYIKSPQFRRQIERLITGSAQPNFGPSHLKKVVINLPEICNQREAVEQFTKVEAVINKRQKEIELLDDLIKSRFIEIFGDPVHNPKGWTVKPLGELSVQINSGNTPKGGEQVYVEKGIMFFRSQNVWKDRIEMDDIAYIDEETHASMSRSSLKHGDILMTKTGRINTENSSLGRAALYMGEDDAANVNGHVYFIRLKPGVNNKFILRILVSDEYRDYIRSVCVGGIDKRQLNKNHIEDFPIICPPDDMVDEYISLVEQTDKLKLA